MRSTPPLNIGLIVDHPKRDLGGAVRIAHALARRGAATSLIPLYDQGSDVPLLGLDALVVNYARPVNLPLVRSYVASGIPVFVLDTEGGILSEEGANSPSGLTRYMAESGYGELLSGYLFWGPLLRDVFLERGVMAAGLLHVTGCPRFDFASARWDATLAFPRTGYVLVNANFPLVNPRFAEGAEAESQVLVRSGWPADYVSRMVQDQRAILRGYLATIKTIAKVFPGQEFLVRPHPFENADLYRTEFANLPNITVDGSGNVLNAIRHSRCVLHLNCGTAIEAVMLRRVPISMEFLNTPHMARHSTLPSRISLKADSLERLCESLERLAETEDAFDFQEPYKTFIEPYFHYNDGCAGDRVAEVVLSNLVRKPRRRLLASLNISLRSSRTDSRAGQRLQALVANLLGSAAAASIRSFHQPKRRDKLISAAAVRSLARQLEKHEGRPDSKVGHARHPISGLPLSTIRISP